MEGVNRGINGLSLCGAQQWLKTFQRLWIWCGDRWRRSGRLADEGLEQEVMMEWMLMKMFR